MELREKVQEYLCSWFLEVGALGGEVPPAERGEVPPAERGEAGLRAEEAARASQSQVAGGMPAQALPPAA